MQEWLKKCIERLDNDGYVVIVDTIIVNSGTHDWAAKARKKTTGEIFALVAEEMRYTLARWPSNKKG